MVNFHFGEYPVVAYYHYCKFYEEKLLINYLTFVVW